MKSRQEVFGLYRRLKNYLFDSRAEMRFFFVLLLIGFTASIFTFHLLDGYKFSSGKRTVGIFIPPLIAVLYVTVIAFKYRLNKKHLLKVLILFAGQIIPFFPLFFQLFQPTEADDFARYFLYANNMVHNHTLWGGDKLLYTNAGNYYVTQPGYRYFIAIELLLFGGLYRISTFVNIAIYLAAVVYFQLLIQKIAAPKKLQRAMLLLVLLLCPYAIKNLLLGVPEWITAVLLISSTYLFVVSGRKMSAIFLLGLIPFFRQNLLLTILLLAGYIIYKSYRKIPLLLCFLLPVFLPFYHNMYYAGELRFFADVHRFPFLTYNAGEKIITGLNTGLIINNIVHYAGLEWVNGHLSVSLIAVIFLPAALVVYLLILSNIGSVRLKIFFIACTMSSIIPVLLLGLEYYPRFEFMNVIVMLVTYVFGSQQPAFQESKFAVKENA